MAIYFPFDIHKYYPIFPSKEFLVLAKREGFDIESLSKQEIKKLEGIVEGRIESESLKDIFGPEIEDTSPGFSYDSLRQTASRFLQALNPEKSYEPILSYLKDELGYPHWTSSAHLLSRFYLFAHEGHIDKGKLDSSVPYIFKLGTFNRRRNVLPYKAYYVLEKIDTNESNKILSNWNFRPNKDMFGAI